jgi:thiamine transport system substrate-binding protein
LNEHTERYQPLVLDDAAYAQIEGMGIVKGSKNVKLAQDLVEYILTPGFQSLIPENQYMYPICRDIKLPSSFRIAAHAKKLLNLPPTQVSNKLEHWQSEWEKVINE